MDIGEFLATVNLFDLLVILGLFGFFVLGFIQGTIRRLMGIASMAFSFVFAANVKEPLGVFLGENWTQFPKEYAAMIGFLTVFVAATVAFSIVIQGSYRRQELFVRGPVVDEILGGFLGIFQGLMLLVFVTIILGSYFRLGQFAVDPDEIGFLRTFWDAIFPSSTGRLLNEGIIPAFFSTLGFLVPESIRELWGR